MDRDADGAGLVGDGAGDGLPDPPGGVGGELVAALVLELFDGAHEANVALLDEVEEVHAAVDILLGDRDDEAEVGLNHLGLGALGAVLSLVDLLDGGAELVGIHRERLAQADEHVAGAGEAVLELDEAGLIEGTLLPLLAEFDEHDLNLGSGPAELALALFDPLFAALERGELLAERLCEFEDNARVEAE